MLFVASRKASACCLVFPICCTASTIDLTARCFATFAADSERNSPSSFVKKALSLIGGASATEGFVFAVVRTSDCCSLCNDGKEDKSDTKEEEETKPAEVALFEEGATSAEEEDDEEAGGETDDGDFSSGGQSPCNHLLLHFFGEVLSKSVIWLSCV